MEKFSKDSNHKEILTIRKKNNLFVGDEIKNKNNILEYLLSFDPYAISSQNIIDKILNIEIEDCCDAVYIDGKYRWNEVDIYHFEKYNMPLDDKFIEYVLSK